MGNGTKKQRVAKKDKASLAGHVAGLTSQIHAGVANALGPTKVGAATNQVAYATSPGPRVNPKTISVTITYTFDVE
jgi:hypothetical protein